MCLVPCRTLVPLLQTAAHWPGWHARVELCCAGLVWQQQYEATARPGNAPVHWLHNLQLQCCSPAAHGKLKQYSSSARCQQQSIRNNTCQKTWKNSPIWLQVQQHIQGQCLLMAKQTPSHSDQKKWVGDCMLLIVMHSKQHSH